MSVISHQTMADSTRSRQQQQEQQQHYSKQVKLNKQQQQEDPRPTTRQAAAALASASTTSKSSAMSVRHQESCGVVRRFPSNAATTSITGSRNSEDIDSCSSAATVASIVVGDEDTPPSKAAKLAPNDDSRPITTATSHCSKSSLHSILAKRIEAMRGGRNSPVVEAAAPSAESNLRRFQQQQPEEEDEALESSFATAGGGDQELRSDSPLPSSLRFIRAAHGRLEPGKSAESCQESAMGIAESNASLAPQSDRISRDESSLDLPDYIKKIQEPDDQKLNSGDQNNLKYSKPRLVMQNKPPGMPNMGNTCYLNASLQCLLHLLSDFWQGLQVFDPHSHDSSSPEESGRGRRSDSCMLCQVKNLGEKRHNSIYKCNESQQQQNAQSMANVHGRVSRISPHSIYHIAKKANSKVFGNGKQADSHEFICLVINQMLQNICGSKFDFAKEQKTQLFKVFGGLLNSKLSCTSCNYHNNTTDPFINVSLSIQPPPNIHKSSQKSNTLMNCLERFFSPEVISPIQGYKCEKCNLPSEAHKQYTLKRLPQTLLIHLKRFSPSMKHSFNSYSSKNKKHNNKSSPKFVKNNSHLYFPELLDLSKFYDEDQTRSNEADCSGLPEEDYRSHLTCYRLEALIIHHGNSMNSGHYVCKIRQDDNKWYEFDDENVQECRKESVFNSNAYILFYKKIEKNMRLATKSEMDKKNNNTTTNYDRTILQRVTDGQSSKQDESSEDIGVSNNPFDSFDENKSPNAKRNNHNSRHNKHRNNNNNTTTSYGRHFQRGGRPDSHSHKSYGKRK
ncbi:MAG: Ubiquitin carboxyl-terminal hydrolase 42 [Marteilia pararefringens]